MSATRLMSELLVLVMVASWCSLSSGQTLNCTIWEAQRFRDCTCGVQYLDYEQHCHDDHTYFEPTLHQDTLECPFQCQNGGTLHVIDAEAEIYHCTCRGRKFGDCCEKETLCGEVMLTPTGIMKTPNFPRPYPRNRRCVWKIITDPGKRIALGVKSGSFSVEEGSSINTCDRDYVAVYDGESKESQRIGPFCGNMSRPFQTIHSTGRHLYIEFQSNDEIQYSGFELEYTTYRTGLRCGPRSQYTLPTAIVTSPQYPLMHKPQEECEYEIVVQPRHELIISTLHMNLPSSADCLQGDVIHVMKKSNSTDRYKRLTNLCGRENYAPIIIRNSSHVMLRFSSGYVHGGQFKLRYEQIPEFAYR